MAVVNADNFAAGPDTFCDPCCDRSASAADVQHTHTFLQKGNQMLVAFFQASPVQHLVGAGGHAGTMLCNGSFHQLTSSRTSVTFPVIAAAAALSGLARNVLDRGPCLPSKFLFEVEMQYFPGGILSSFIPRQAEQPGPLSSKPASWKTLSRP